MENEIKRLIEICKKRYPPGVRINNAWEKYKNGGNISSGKIESEFKFFHYIDDNAIKNLNAIHCRASSCGLLYVGGAWADIVDINGNIIKSFNNETDEDLEEIRVWLWK